MHIKQERFNLGQRVFRDHCVAAVILLIKNADDIDSSTNGSLNRSEYISHAGFFSEAHGSIQKKKTFSTTHNVNLFLVSPWFWPAHIMRRRAVSRTPNTSPVVSAAGRVGLQIHLGVYSGPNRPSLCEKAQKGFPPTKPAESWLASNGTLAKFKC